MCSHSNPKSTEPEQQTVSFYKEGKGLWAYGLISYNLLVYKQANGGWELRRASRPTEPGAALESRRAGR